MKTQKRLPFGWQDNQKQANGDYDDIGRKQTESAYHYQQKKQRGKL